MFINTGTITDRQLVHISTHHPHLGVEFTVGTGGQDNFKNTFIFLLFIYQFVKVTTFEFIYCFLINPLGHSLFIIIMTRFLYISHFCAGIRIYFKNDNVSENFPHKLYPRHFSFQDFYLKENYKLNFKLLLA